ncbi:MAG: Asp-tRNA(Asn)/Glu-tRNA(Gln) amidotransferase subunit GatB [Candidatus Lokiarchaeota archaeon]|nr:Asp-tRNA(Asn)/Glu-tRNA(Gln) amidotransferase subunit GatB [Candidatus Lokiarchaeota archaeon]
MATNDDMEVIIGLEIHLQLNKLRTKMWCPCTTDYQGKEPNSVLCPVCLALPGTLPVLNKKAVDFAIMLGLALKSEIQKETFFYRKNYYYPDMCKNFQISQYDKAGGVPICVGGELTFRVGKEQRTVHFARVHMEEDPGRLAYDGSITTSPVAYIDYNRHGMALLEAVTKPELRSPEEARAFLKKLRAIVEHLGIADLALEGSMRCDANISYKGHARVEVKNISSMKEVEKALTFEMMRQKQKIKGGGEIVQETRHWDEVRRVTVSLRTKETEKDYRYFPEPDLVPITVDKRMLDVARKAMPELPDARIQRFVRQYQIPEYDAGVLCDSKAMADFYEATVKLFNDAKDVSNWLMGDVSRRLNEDLLEIEETKLAPAALAQLLQLIKDRTITGKIAKGLVKDMLAGTMPADLVKKNAVKRIDDVALLDKLAREVIAENPKVVTEVKEGKNPRTFEFLVGQIMKKTKGQADPEITRDVLKKLL